jgi:DNA-binding MarR family transcriptional regulator
MKKMRKGGLLITKVHQLAGRVFSRMLKQYDLSEINPAQGRILFVLWEKDGIPITELAEKTRLEKSTLTSMLDRLEQAGLIVREFSKEDRRKIFIHRTKKDLDFQKTYFAISAEMTDVFYKGFSQKEIDDFEMKLQMILENLTEYESVPKKS